MNDPFCRAPRWSLYLDQRGSVRACCQNTAAALGRIGDASLRAIWDGPIRARLAQAVEHDDLRAGCDFCAWQRAEGGRETAYARAFDNLGTSGTDDWPEQIEFALSNTCNLQCAMCNGEWSSAIRRHRDALPPLPQVYDDAFFEDLAEFVPHLRTARFLGGEPFLASEARRVFDLLRRRNPTCRVQVTTNGTIWNREVEQVLTDLAVDVTVSVDGATAPTFESIRRGARFDDVRRNLDRFAEATRRSGTRLDLAICLVRDNWHELRAILELATDLGAGAYVNTVVFPPEHSLYSLDAPALHDVTRGLRSIGPPADPHARLWEQEVSRLEARARAGGGLAPALAGKGPIGLLAADRSGQHVSIRQPSTETDQRSIVAAWAQGAPVLELLVDTEGTLRRVEPPGAEVFGVQLADCLGLPLEGIADRLAPSVGQPGAARVLERDPDRIDQVVPYGADGAVESRMIMTARRDPTGSAVGFVVHAAFRVRPAEAPT